MGVDLFTGPYADYLVADFQEKAVAIQAAKERARKMAAFYVYSDTGECVFSTR